MATITETGTIDLKAQKKAHDEAAKTATNYITADSTGITVRMSSSATTYQRLTATDTTWYASGKKRSSVSGDGLKVFIGDAGSEVQVASFGSTARIGKATEGHIDITSSGMNVYTNNTTNVASFGSSTRIGPTNQPHMLIGSTGIDLYDATNTRFMNLGGFSEGGNSYGGITVQGAPNVRSTINTETDGNIHLNSYSTYDDENYGAGIDLRAARYYGTNGNKSDVIEIQMFANDLDRALRINEYTPTANGTLAEFGGFRNYFLKRSDFSSEAHFDGRIYVDEYISSSEPEVKFAKSPAVYANVNLHATTIDRDGSAPSQNVYEDTRTFRIVDVDSAGLVTIRASQATTGTIYAQTIVWNTKTNGDTVYNIFSVGIGKDGSQTYTISNPTNFRNTLGASSGVFPRSVGGTGMSERTTGTVTRTGLSTSTGTIAAYSNGVMNTISAGSCKLKTALDAGNSVVLATVPEGYRPPMSMFANVCSSSAAGIGKAYVQVTSTGDIEFHPSVAWSTNANIAFTISWAK